MNESVMKLLLNKIQNDPKINSSPMARQFIQIMQSGDQNAGIEMANNILNTLGLSKDQAIQQASNGLSRMRF